MTVMFKMCGRASLEFLPLSVMSDCTDADVDSIKVCISRFSTNGIIIGFTQVRTVASWTTWFYDSLKVSKLTQVNYLCVYVVWASGGVRVVAAMHTCTTCFCWYCCGSRLVISNYTKV